MYFTDNNASMCCFVIYWKKVSIITDNGSICCVYITDIAKNPASTNYFLFFTDNFNIVADYGRVCCVLDATPVYNLIF